MSSRSRAPLSAREACITFSASGAGSGPSAPARPRNVTSIVGLLRAPAAGVIAAISVGENAMRALEVKRTASREGSPLAPTLSLAATPAMRSSSATAW